MTTHPRRSINAVAPLLEAARERGCAPQALLAGTGIRLAQLRDAAATVSFEQEYRLIRNLLRLGDGAAGLGLEVGLRYRFTSIAPVGFAIVSSPTFRSAFDVVLRFADLNTSMAKAVLDAPGEDLRIGFRDEHLPPDLRPFAVERSMGATLAIARELLGRRPAPQSMTLRAPPCHLAVYRRLAGVRPAFAQPKNLLVLKQRDVDVPLARANPIALRLAEEQCQRYLEAWKRRDGLAARVRELLAHQPRAMPSLGEVASALCMSERTLRRRLQEEGTGFAALCDETRQAIAEQLLTMPRLPIEQIAERLGYSETAAFIHAFKRWKGQSPHAYRLGRAPRET